MYKQNYCNDSENIGSSPGFLMGRTLQAVRTVFRRRMAEEGLDVTPEQLGVLHWLRLSPGMSQRNLADTVGKEMPTMTRMIDALERRGWVRRERDETDRRVYRLHLTEEGDRIGREVCEKFGPLRDSVFGCFDEQEEKELVRLLQKLFNHATSLVE